MSQPVTNEIILDAIDKGLSSLGDCPKQAIWYRLEKDFKLDRNKVPENLDAFEETLESFFGLGYRFLESLFRQYLKEATGEDLQCYRTFADCISGLRKKTESIEVHDIVPEFLKQKTQ
jgi:hypothetical protein